MNLTIHPDGTVEATDLTMDEARVFIQVAKEASAPAKISVPVKRGRPLETEVISELSEVQTQTWQFLVAHGASTATDYATSAGISPNAAYARLAQLNDMKLAHQVKRGLWAPGPDKRKTAQ